MQILPQKTDESIELLPSPTWSQFEQIAKFNMLLQGFSIHSIADIPCRDVDNLCQHNVQIENYYGITDSIETAHMLQAKYGSSRYTFHYLDILTDVLPAVDMILSWDMLCSLSPSRVRAALYQFKKSGAKYILMANYPDHRENRKNRTGRHLPINWEKAPYNLPKPIIQICQEEGDCPMYLALWKMETIP